MAIPRKKGMTDAEFKAANAAVSAARIANNKPAPAIQKAVPYEPGTAYNPQYGNPLNTATSQVIGTPTGSATTSGLITNFEPIVDLPTPIIKPGEPGFVGPVKLTEVDVPKVSKETKKVSKETQDAFEIMYDILNQQGIGSLADDYMSLMTLGFTAAEALNKLKYDKNFNSAYTARFSGNEKRKAMGLNVMSEKSYLELEDSYANTLRSYGLGNMLSTDSKKNQEQFAVYMGQDLDSEEFKDRIKEVSTGVINADSATKETFKKFFPSLTDSDLVAYFLRPDETLPILKQKVAAAGIGGVAAQQVSAISATRAMDLAQFGVTRDTALTGYEQIGGILQDTTKLSDIYSEEKINYGQAMAEDEYLKQDAKSKLKRNRLASKERAMFAGNSNISNPGGSSTSNAY